jgi:hypothetical protein
MEMHAIDVDDVGGLAESLVDIPIFEDSIPDTIGARFVVQNALVGQGCFRIDHRIERFILDLHQFGSVIGEAGRFRDYGHDRLALVAYFGDGQRIIFDSGAGIRSDFDEWLCLCRDLRPREHADNAREIFGGRHVNAYNLRVSIGRAHEFQIQHFA